jgi:hypothetical protein
LEPNSSPFRRAQPEPLVWAMQALLVLLLLLLLL